MVDLIPRVYLLNPPAQSPILREGRCQSLADMRQTAIPQLSLAYLASGIKRLNVEIRLRDAVAESMDLAKIVAELKQWRPQIIFINTSTPSIMQDLNTVAAIKDILPESFVAAFGAHVSAMHASILRGCRLDAVIRGEPEIVGARIVERVMAGAGMMGLKGLTHRFGDRIYVGDGQEPLEHLDDLGWPARELLPQRHYRHPVLGRAYTMIAISRGCPQRCIFCVAPLYYGRTIRKRSAKDVLDEIESDIQARHGIDLCWFYADDLLADRPYLRSICEGIIKRGLKIKWWGNTRADVQDQQLFFLMARAGCYMLSIGGESGDDDILRAARKNINAEDVVKTVSMLRRSGIISLVYFIVGLPGETKESLQRTMGLAKRTNPDYVEFYPAVPYPGTELETVAEGQGLIVDRDWSHYSCGGTDVPLRTQSLKQEELNRFLRTAYLRFYGRPFYLLKIIGAARVPDHFFRLCQFGMKYLLYLTGRRKCRSAFAGYAKHL